MRLLLGKYRRSLPSRLQVPRDLTKTLAFFYSFQTETRADFQQGYWEECYKGLDGGLTRRLLDEYGCYIGVGPTDDALRARQVNNSFDLSFFLEVLFEKRDEICRGDGDGTWLGG
jgi:hypothetical protein